MRALLSLWMVFLPSLAFAQREYALNFQPPVTDTAAQIYELHMLIFWICVAIGVVVFGAMIYSIIMHRKSRGVKAANFHESTTVEIIWTAIPFAILIAMAIPATLVLVDMADTSKSDMTIKITGSQFKWQDDYLHEDISIISALSTPEEEIYGAQERGENYLLEVDNPVVVPTDTKIRFLLTAADVLHAWWVPAIAVKKDAVPGFINEMWTVINEPGTYRGQCAELCGAKHGFMPIVLVAKTPEDYQVWVAEQQAAIAAEKAALESGKEWTMAELMERGEKIYAANCAVCHQASGAGMPPAFPGLVGSDLVVNQPEEVQLRQILYGKGAMPAFGAALNDLDIAAVATYTKNAWGNDTSKIIQPNQVKDLRAQGRSAGL